MPDPLKAAYAVYDKENLPTFTDLVEFGEQIHPGIAQILEGYARGYYDYEEALMLCLRLLMDEYVAIRAAAEEQTGNGFGPLVRFRFRS